jgi:hypothetical protein
MINMPNGKRIAIETKNWAPTNDNIAKAQSQAEALKKTTAADEALIVFPELTSIVKNGNLVNPGSMLETIDILIDESSDRSQPSKNKLIVETISKTIFAAMPFDTKYRDTYYVAMARASEDVRATCIRVDQEQYTGDIVTRIKNDIRNCTAVFADLSESKPNVLYETGFAQALNKPVILMCSTPLKDIPFDVSHENTIEYVVGNAGELLPKLKERLKPFFK